jgi:hypothetical protein
MAIEYYDTIFNHDFHVYYLNKINELMNKKPITKYLDEIYKISNTEQIDILKYDAEKLKDEIFRKNNTSNQSIDQMSIELDFLKSFEDCKLDEKLKNNKMKKKLKLVSKIKNYKNQTNAICNDYNKEKLYQTLNDFYQNLDKLKDNIKNDVQSQLSRFEELKKKKKKKEITKDKNFDSNFLNA